MCPRFPEVKQVLPPSGKFIMPGTGSILTNQTVEITLVINYNVQTTI